MSEDDAAKDILELQEIMNLLPSVNGENDRRKYSLTKDDVLLIYQIATIARQPHTCPFTGEKAQVLSSVAGSITRTQKIASYFIITGIVSSILGGIWYATKHVVQEFIRAGGAQ